jgi:hypothetical protein
MDTTELVAATPEEAVTTEALEPTVDSGQGVECVIHLRFFPDGTVAEIGERPPGVKAQDWFKYLTQHTSNRYQALSGGRGLFRLPRPEVAALKAACAAEHAS